MPDEQVIDGNKPVADSPQGEQTRQGTTIGTSESTSDSLQKELDALMAEGSGTEDSSEPESSPEIPETSEKAKWWEDLKNSGVVGIDSEEKAIEWTKKSAAGIKSTFQENAALRKQLAELVSPKTAEKEPTWDELLNKYSTKDENGNIASVNYDGLFREQREMTKREFLADMRGYQQTQHEIERSVDEIHRLSKEGAIPEYRPTIFDERGNVKQEGTPFADKVDGYLQWSIDEFSKTPFHLHPHREFVATVFALGMEQIQKNEAKTKKKVSAIASMATGSRNVRSTEDERDISLMSDDEITKEAERIIAGR